MCACGSHSPRCGRWNPPRFTRNSHSSPKNHSGVCRAPAHPRGRIGRVGLARPAAVVLRGRVGVPGEPRRVPPAAPGAVGPARAHALVHHSDPDLPRAVRCVRPPPLRPVPATGAAHPHRHGVPAVAGDAPGRRSALGGDRPGGRLLLPRGRRGEHPLGVPDHDERLAAAGPGAPAAGGSRRRLRALGRGGAGRRPGGAHVLRYHRHDDRHIDACRAAPAQANGFAARVQDIYTFLWTGLTHVADAAVGLTGAGGVLLLGLLLWLLRRLPGDGTGSPDRSRLPPGTGLPDGMSAAEPEPPTGLGGSRWPAAAMAAGAILLFVLVSVGRVDYGLDFAKAPRYVYLVSALLLPAVGLVFSELATGGAVRGFVVALLVGVLGLHGIAELLTQRQVRLHKEVPARGQILAAADLLASGAMIVQQPVDDVWNPDLLASDLQQLRAAGDLPAGFTVTDDDRLRAALDLQVVFRPTPELLRTGGARLVEAKAATAAAVAALASTR